MVGGRWIWADIHNQRQLDKQAELLLFERKLNSWLLPIPTCDSVFLAGPVKLVGFGDMAVYRWHHDRRYKCVCYP